MDNYLSFFCLDVPMHNVKKLSIMCNIDKVYKLSSFYVYKLTKKQGHSMEEFYED